MMWLGFKEEWKETSVEVWLLIYIHGGSLSKMIKGSERLKRP